MNKLEGLDYDGEFYSENINIVFGDKFNNSLAKIGSKNFELIKKTFLDCAINNKVIFIKKQDIDGENYNLNITNDMIEEMHLYFSNDEMEVFSENIITENSNALETVKQQQGQLYILFQMPTIIGGYSDDFDHEY